MEQEKVGGLFSELSELLFELGVVVGDLCGVVGLCGVGLPEGEAWYELLVHKLIPQMDDRAYLIVAVMGGTNTGKSLLFNHLARENCSGVDYRASGTKHPVCIISESVVDPLGLLGRNFGNFEFVLWSNSFQPLEAGSGYRLFWKAGRNLPERLLILDTPDIDSDSEVNWEQACEVRHVSDVVVAVLTSQKYNDAAVRRFFREAAEAGKPIVVLFNMLNFDVDKEYFPVWLKQFCEETQAVPIVNLAAPFDEGRASELRLPYYGVSGENCDEWEEVDLHRVLTELHFDRIKSQTLMGAIRVLADVSKGIPSYLRRIELASVKFSDALSALERANSADEVELPAIPVSVLAEEVRRWWHEEKRPAWSQKINNIYRVVGGKLVMPLVKLRDVVAKKVFAQGERYRYRDDNLQLFFREREESAAVTFVEKVFKRLETLAQTDNPVLRCEMQNLTSGVKRVELLERAKSVLGELEPVDVSFHNAVRTNLSEWSAKNHFAVNLLQSIDQVVTLVRPVVTVSLVLGGFAIGSVIAAPFVAEVAMIGGVTAGGEAILHSSSETIKLSIARLLQKIQEDFVIARSKKFHTEFLRELWQDVVNRLKSGANIAESDQFKKCQECVQKIIQKLKANDIK
jgi:hypothetical protein